MTKREKIVNKIKERLEQLNIKQIIKVFGVFLLDTLINVFQIIIIIPLLVCYILTDILLKISLYLTKIKDC
jgi:hypothetical protein